MGRPTYEGEGPVLVLTPETTVSDTVSWPNHITGDLGVLFVCSKIYPTGSGDLINQTTVDASWEFSGFGEAHIPSPPAFSHRIDVYYRIAESSAEDDVLVSIPTTSGDDVDITTAFICTFRGYDLAVILNGIADNYTATHLCRLNAPETTSPNCLLVYCVQIRTDLAYNSAAFGLSSDADQNNPVFRFQNLSTVEDSGDAGTLIVVGTADELASRVDHFLELHPSVGTPSPDPFPAISYWPSSFFVGIAIAGTEDVPPEPPPPTPSVPFPDALIQDGYQNNFSDQLIEIELSGGLSRRRQDSYFAGHIVTVQWLLTREEYAQFMGFFKTDLRHGVDPFLIDLITDIGVPTTHRARTLGGLPRLTRQTGNAYYVSCTLQCERNPTYTGNIIYQEDGDIVFAVDNPTFAECFASGDTLRIIDSAGIHPTGSTPINLDGEYTVLSTTGFNVVTLDNPASVNSNWTVLAGLGSGIEYGDEDNGNVISTITRVPT